MNKIVFGLVKVDCLWPSLVKI